MRRPHEAIGVIMIDEIECHCARTSWLTRGLHEATPITTINESEGLRLN